ncbi:MAG: TRAP transporter large permease subunit [Alphaproteobacteria bacterium]|nr:TRAP transporter large permease subunit [Alphaproteobacteria bacterium]MCW5743796.1 TRAP transporter large permease subunit [Alphaproteobacteria bacterium]
MSSLWMFPALIAAILTGFPVALAMMSLAVIFGVQSFGLEGLQYQFIQKIEETATAQVLAAVPLFIFMGAMFQASGIASRLFDAIHMWTRRVPGGMAVGTVLMCVIFAATSGVVGATETVVGLLAIPAMLRYGYSKSLISGTICAGGSLGTIIPPSVLAVVIGPVASASVGNIMLGMFVPGFMLALAYIIYIVILCTLKPEYGPRLPKAADEPPLGAKLLLTGKVLVPPVVVIVAVLGSMMAGIATPTEASATGALGTVLLAVAYRRLSWTVLVDSTMRTVRITAMILTIVVCGQMFAAVFVGSGGLIILQEFLAEFAVGKWGLLFLVMFIVFVAGFMLEPLVVILMVVPITAPLIEAAGFDKVWFCVLFLVMLQTGYLTPPMAPSIFYLRGIAPPEITLRHMYFGIWPFIGIQLLVITLLVWQPRIVTWLPDAVLTGVR